jgi:hypothetical protein
VRCARSGVVGCGCPIALLTFGVRSSFGLFTIPLPEAHGWGREVLALAIAVQSPIWGAAQLFAGALADRLGGGRACWPRVGCSTPGHDAGGRRSERGVLAAISFLRAVVIAFIVLAPVSAASVSLFAPAAAA